MASGDPTPRPASIRPIERGMTRAVSQIRPMAIGAAARSPRKANVSGMHRTAKFPATMVCPRDTAAGNGRPAKRRAATMPRVRSATATTASAPK
jgi:hypothetical protein